ncbi:MAG: relaxase MobL, partial [Firmicutes bacterium]|nr:relaxase MobL [Bacillota bacterium]
MAKIILRCNYLRDAPPEHQSNFVKYIGTREGVEKIDDSKALLPATVKQQNLIKQILKDIDGAKDMHEYTDYLLNPTRENASEFITLALENNLDLIGKRKNYVDYIANRPRVEKIGEHGLFTDAGTPVILSQVADEIANHKGVIWTHVISLRREDAARLGYDSAKEWRELIRSKRAMLAKNMKIASENLKWYCAFHNESHHPHVHLVVYSKNEKEGYLTNKGIEAMRSEFAHSIFRQDFMNIYDRQNEYRSFLKEKASDVMREMIREIQSGVCANKKIEELITHLAERLKHTSGKKQYGYLKAPLKAVIDEIVDELAKDERVAKFYVAWNERQNEILETYSDRFPPLKPLSTQKQFKSIKNMVIAEALNIGSHRFVFEPDYENETSIAEHEDNEDGTAVIFPAQDFIADLSFDNTSEDDGPQEFQYHARWSDRYKEARAFLYCTDDVEQNFSEAYRLFMEEAEIGNALAMYDLGWMHMDGLGVEMNLDAGQDWYAKALIAFLEVESNKSSPYIQYRIGKMHNAGLGTPQNYSEAADWFHMAVAKNHKYAQYSLAGLYYHGHGVEQCYETAFDLYRKSAAQKNPYASYELAKMHRDGVGTDKSIEKADEHFQKAFTGFLDLEAQSKDDKLQYRLGQMLYTGTGTEKDIPVAIEYLEKSAKLGNVNAQYMLSKIYLEEDTDHENVEKALEWLAIAAYNGNTLAQYALAKLYRDGSHVDKDMAKAVELFTKSAEQENQYAQYALGKLYLSGEGIPKDTDAAVNWLILSLDQGNQFAQYTLAKLYLTGEDIDKDIAKAVELFTKSALQNNQYAAYQL